MPFLSDVTVIDIGSKSICAYRAERLSEDNFSVKSSFEMEYSGYMDGKWLCPEELFPTVSKLIDRIERGCGKVKSVVVGIPAGFCAHRVVNARVTFPKKKKITPTDLSELYAFNDPFSSGDCVRLLALPIGFLTEEGESATDAVGLVTNSLRCRISYIGAYAEILSDLKQVFYRCGIKDVSFLQSEYASAAHLFGAEERESGVLVADIGYLATTVLYLGGAGVLEMKTFSLGGGFVPAGLSEALAIPFGAAEYLSSRINLGYKDEGFYEFDYETNRYSFPIGEVNEMVKECVDYVASYIGKALEAFRFDLPSDATLYLSGGGFSSVRGAREYLSKALSRKVEYVLPSVPNLNKPYYATAVGLLKEALGSEKKHRFGILKKLFGK